MGWCVWRSPAQPSVTPGTLDTRLHMAHWSAPAGLLRVGSFLLRHLKCGVLYSRVVASLICSHGNKDHVKCAPIFAHYALCPSKYLEQNVQKKLRCCWNDPTFGDQGTAAQPTALCCCVDQPLGYTQLSVRINCCLMVHDNLLNLNHNHKYTDNCVMS